MDDEPCMNSCTCEPVADGDPDAQNCWCEEVCDRGGDEILDRPPQEGVCLPEGWVEEFKSVDDGIYYEGNDEQAGTGDPRDEDTYAGGDVATVGDTAPTGEADNTSTKKSSTSCAVGNGPSTSGAALLALLMLGLAVLRRRHPQL
jgi:MYXO-CTERM domain-containing protein